MKKISRGIFVSLFFKTAIWSVISIFFLFLSSSIYANYSSITGVTINPPNPGLGQSFSVSIQMCLDEYDNPNDLAVAASTSSAFQNPGTSGQVFLLSSLGVNVHSSNPNNAGSGDTDFGYQLTQPSPFIANCSDCASSYAMSVTESYNLTMPSAAELGSQCSGASTIYLLVGSYSFEFLSYDWTSLYSGDCGAYVTSWSLPAPPANSITLDQRAEGVLQSVGDMVLYSVDYTYGNGQPTITDSLPGNGSLALVSYGPVSITGGTISAPALNATAGTITWTFPSSTTTKQGTVWLLMQMTTAISAGTQVTNTASATSGSNNTSSSATITVGQPAVSVQKLESTGSLTALAGNSATITYYLNYEVNGDQLKAYRSFDGTALGTYNSPTPPSGWKFVPYGTDYGTWTISDTCGTGDRVLTGAGQTNSWPSLLLDDPTPSNVQICTGIIEADVYIYPGADVGADGLVILRSNGLTGNLNYSYALLLSIDTTPADGYAAVQKCSAGTCSWYGAETSLPITGDTWYRTKTLMTQSGNDYVFQYKIWQVGQPEPSGYLGIWTDSGAAVNANFNCSGTGTYLDWRPGVGEQSGYSGNEQDTYNNFITYAPRTAANAVLFDTIPAGLTYAGSSPAGTNTAGLLTWNLGSISYQSGSYTWWASTNACGQSFTNVAGIGGTTMASQFSNPVVSSLNCISPTISATCTITPTPPPPTGTYTATVPSSTFTNIPTQTVTMTMIITNTFTPLNTRTVTSTYTCTPTPSISPVVTSTPTYTFTLYVSPTNTITPTPTATNSIVVSNTPTYSTTPVVSPTPSPTASAVVSPTMTVAINLVAGITVSPATASIGQAVTVIMQVTNTSFITAVNVQPSTLSQSGSGAASLVSGPNPVSVTMAGPSQTWFTWVYSIAICGNLAFNGTASGADGVDGVIKTSAPAISNTFTCGTPTPTPIPGVNICTVDTMASCNSVNIWGGSWFTYNDSSSGGNSTVWPPTSSFIMSSPGFGGAGDCAAQLTGTIGTAYAYPYVGMGTLLNAYAAGPTFQATDLSGAIGVLFEIKGDGKSYNLIVPYTNSSGAEMDGYYCYQFTFSTMTNWTQTGAPFSMFTQPSDTPAQYQFPITTVLQNAKQIQWQCNAAAPNTVDLWIDNLQMYGCPFVATSVMTATETFTPVPPGSTMTNTPSRTYTTTITPTFTCTPTPASLCSVDTMASCSSVNIWGGGWFTYNDNSNGGTSVVWPPSGAFVMSSPGFGGAGDCAAQMTGVVTIAYQYGFIGMGTQLNPNAGSPNYQSTDLSGAAGISFYTKGDGGIYTIIIPYMNSSGNTMTNWDDYRYTFVAFSGWSQYTIPFTSFTQPSYTPAQYQFPITTVLQNAKQFQFATTTQPLASVDLWIDNLAIYGCIIPTYTPSITATSTSVPSGSTMTNTPTITFTSTITLTYTMTPTVNPNTICYSLQWGTPGAGSGQFDYPYGVAVDTGGYIYVADLYNNRIQKFTSTGAYITQWGSSGSGNGQFSYPVSIAIDTGGYVYVTDWSNSRVEKFTSTGTYVTQWGSFGTGTGQFEYPYGIAVDSSGYLYVTDVENGRVEKFTSAGAYVTQWGTNGTGNSQFSYPAGIAVDSSGYVYVTDSYNYRIQKFTSAGAYVTQWGSSGSGNGQFAYPYGITIGGNGYAYVADTNNNRVQEFTSTGTYITQWGSYGTGTGQFNGPIGIVTDSTGAIYVSDYNNNRVEKFTLCNQGTPTPTPVVTATPTFTVTPTQAPLCQVDTMASCSNTNIWGGYWYTYNDSGDGGTSSVWPIQGSTFVMSSPGYGGGADCAAQMTGVVTTVYSAGFIGMGTKLNSIAGSPNFEATDLSGATGIRFYAKGDGSIYQVKLPYTDSGGNELDGYNNYAVTFTASASGWTLITVPFASMTQATGWGTIVPLLSVLQNAKDIQWQSDTRPLANADLWIDNLEIYGCIIPTKTNTPVVSATATASPSRTASATFTNTPTMTDTVTSTRTNTQVPSGSTMTITPTMTPTIAINLVAGLVVMPSSAAQGQDVTVLMEVVNVGTDTANSVKPSPLFQTGGGAAVLISSPSSSGVNIGGSGAYAMFTWVYSMAICGDIVFNGSASGTDSADGVSMTSPQCSSNTLSCSSGAPTATNTMYIEPGSTYTNTPTLTPTFTMIPAGSTSTITPVVTPTIGINLVAGLTISPVSAGAGQNITVIMQVVNIGTNTANNVVPSSLVQAGGGAAVPVGTVSPSSASISSYGQASFTWVYNVVICNNLAFSGTVSGTDAVDGVNMTSPLCESNMMTCATATPTVSNTMTITPTITLTDTPTITPTIAIDLIASLSLSPSSAAYNQQITVVMQVVNTGMNTANNVLPSLPLTQSGGGAALLVGPSPASTTIEGNSQAYFTWVYKIQICANITFSGTASGTDAVDGVSMTSSQVSTNLFTCATVTMTVTPTWTLTATPTLTATQTVFLSTTSTPTMTMTCTPTPMPAALAIGPVKPYPNPYNPNTGMPLKFAVNVTTGDIDNLTLRIYTASYRLIRQQVFQGADIQEVSDGLIVLQYDSSFLTSLSAGSYYYIVTAQKGGTKVRSKGDAIIILK